MDDAYRAEFYELVHRGTPGDVDFYRAICDGAETVLELGCGGGRVLLALAQAGHEVVGIDMHDGLLAAAQERVAALAAPVAARIELQRADMRSFDLDARFDRVIIPHSGLYCLLSEQEVLDCLRLVRKHLAPGGMLIFDAYAADDFHGQCHPDDQADDQLDPVTAVSHDGTVYDVLERSTWKRDEQRLDVTYLHLPRDGRSVVEGSIAQRYLLGEQVAGLLAAADLSLGRLAGDFVGSAFHSDSDLLVVIASPDGAATETMSSD